MTAQLDFVVQRNTTFLKEITWVDINKTPIDLTDFKFKMQVRPEPNGPVLVYALSETTDVDRKISIPIGNDGKFLIEISADILRDVEPGDYAYDLIVVDTLNHYHRLLEGKFILVDGITLGEPDVP